jgi:[protein-PII] uridylyltransferase
MADNAAIMLKKKKEELIARFIKGGVADFSKDLALLVDDYLFTGFEKSGIGMKMGWIENPYAIIALGSYGRKEPSIRSDLALMFLFEKELPEETEELVKEFVYPLWDNGFEIAHVTRTVEECAAAAQSNTDVLVSLLDGRFICGMSRLFTHLSERIRNTIVPVNKTAILQDIVMKNVERHKRFGDASYLIEPNLKEGQGGLSDFDSLLTITRITGNVLSPDDLRRSGLVSEKEFDELSQARNFTLKVRNLLHHVTGRKCDQLFLEYQPQVAALLRYGRKDGQEPVERFMGDFHGHVGVIKQIYRMVLTEQGLLRDMSKWNPNPGKTRVRGLDVDGKNMLTFRTPEDPLKAPELLIKIFGESASLGLQISVEALRLIRDLAPRFVTPSFRKSRSVLRAFEKILLTGSPLNNALDDMVRTGFMACFIPEFQGIVNRIQYNEYHLFPVDKHTIMTVKKAAMFGIQTNENPFYSDLYGSLSDKRPLLWACLLHDIGKCELSGNHSDTGADMARNILSCMGYSGDFTERVTFLVKEHLFLVKTATRRDINDEETAMFCVKKIKDEQSLVMLFLLTVADSMSTGPKAWNTWTESLLEGLFKKTREIIRQKEYVPDQTLDLLENKKSAVRLQLSAQGYDEKTTEKFVQLLSVRYLIHMEARTIVQHVGLIRKLGSHPFVWDIQGIGGASPRTVTIAAPNKPGIFSKLAGLMTLYGFNILDAQIFTLKNNTALDIFHLSPPADLLFEGERWQKAGEDLGNILTYDINLNVRLADMIKRKTQERLFTVKQPTRIEVDNETSGYFTIIEVHTYDFTGLLFSITHTLYRLGIDIYVSKIATNMDQVVDIFYVRNLYGEKVTSEEQIARIKSEILKVIDHPDK